MINNRYELKFVFNNIETINFINYLSKKSHIKKKYKQRIINSVYFDNIKMKSAIENLSGISQRKKFRVRWYNSNFFSKNVKNCFFEIKSRVGRVSNKKNIFFIDKINQDEFNYNKIYKTYKNLIYCNNSFNIDRDLYPKILVRYSRDYFESIDDIRITVDKKIQFYDASNLFSKIYSGISYSYNQNVIEIKFPIDKKQKIVDFLRLTSMNPIRHSKYLVGLSYINRVLYI